MSKDQNTLLKCKLNVRENYYFLEYPFVCNTEKKTRERARGQHNMLLTMQEHSCQSEDKDREKEICTIVIYFASMLAKHDDDDSR